GSADPAAVALDDPRPGALEAMVADLAAAPSGVGFVYRCLERVVEGWDVQDAIAVVDVPAIGRQAFRAGRRSLEGGWAGDIATLARPGIHTDPPVVDEGGELAAAAELCAVALRIDLLGYDALRDTLTGLYNRRSFDEHLEQAAGRSRRYGWSFSLVLI